MAVKVWSVNIYREIKFPKYWERNEYSIENKIFEAEINTGGYSCRDHSAVGLFW